MATALPMAGEREGTEVQCRIREGISFHRGVFNQASHQREGREEEKRYRTMAVPRKDDATIARAPDLRMTTYYYCIPSRPPAPWEVSRCTTSNIITQSPPHPSTREPPVEQIFETLRGRGRPLRSWPARGGGRRR
jgi:hypothetical protein